MRTKTLAVSLVLLLAAFSTSMFGSVVPVAGTANIFSAGSALFGGGTAPTLAASGFTTSAPQQNLFEFNVYGSGLGGTVSWCPTCGTFGADGAQFTTSPPATNLSAPGNGISGLSFNGRLFFMSLVFLDDNSPSVAPA